MTISAKKALEDINELSRQLLSRVLAAQNRVEIETNTTVVETNDEEESELDSSFSNNELAELMSTRDKLIRDLFAQKKVDELEQELTLLNEMAALDNQLLNHSQACKNVLTKQVIKLKKGEKASKSYQGY